MTDTAIVSGGVRNDALSRVSADQSTILGDGTTEDPLRATGGSISVATDEVTILGDGTEGDPLHAGDVSVTADLSTILGNGTTGDPLRIALPAIAAGLVNSDGTFLSQSGFASLTHPGAGQYSFLLTSPPVNVNDTIPVATILNASVAGQITFVLTVGGFDVVTYNASGVATDRLFSIVVYDLT